MKNVFLLFTLFIFTSFIKYIKNDESIHELQINQEEDFNTAEPIKYTIIFSSTPHENYALIEIFGNVQNTNYVLSLVDDFENQNRIQLAQSVSGKTKLISSFLPHGSNINLILECSDYSLCSGKIKNQILSKIPLEENNPLYFYNTFEGCTFEFSIKSESEILNIWARGNLDMLTNLRGAEYEKYNDGHFYVVNKTSSADLSFNVTGKKGDYINVGYTGYKKNVRNDEVIYDLSSNLVNDGNVITVYLNRNYTDKFCYNINKDIVSKEDIYLSGYDFIGALKAVFYHSPSDTNQVLKYISEGSFIEDKIEKYQSFCFEMNEYNKEALYIFQIYSNNAVNNTLNIFEPQINGNYYTYKLKPSSKIGLISQNPEISDNMFYYLLSSESFSKLYVINCDNYPLCNLDDYSNNNKSLPVIKVGRTSNINIKGDQIYDFSPVNKYQKLFLVKCDDNAQKDCLFSTMINNNNKELTLKASDFLSKKTCKDQIDKYQFKSDKLLEENGFIIEINIFSGDVEFINDFPEGININKNYNLNKLAFLIKSSPEFKFQNLKFSIKSLENSFYTISFFPNTAPDDYRYDNNYKALGFPRLFTFSPTNLTKDELIKINLENEDRKSNIYKTFSINSLNCEIEVAKRENNVNYPLKKSGNFFHEIPRLISDEAGTYEVKLIKDDISDYENKLCKIYLSYKDTLIKEAYDNYVDILVPDNNPQQMIFNKYLTHVSYGYYLEKWENDVIIKYSSKYKAKYIAKIYFSDKKREKEESIIMGDGIIYLNFEEWEDICKDQSCFIKIDIDLVRFEENTEPILELTIKSSQEKAVTYIPKHEIIKDYVHYEKSQYFYTELGKNEVGFINLHFLKGSGKIVAKIVEKNKNETNPDWKGKYVLPNKESKDLVMDTFTKRIIFSTEKYNCENQCYLIVNVFSDIKTEKVCMKRIYPFTIIIQSYPNNYNNTEVPIIKASIDEYITGALILEKEKEMYEFYRIKLNLNKEYVIIDINSGIEQLLVNIGNNRPTINKSDFSFKLNKTENVFIISKGEILPLITDTQDLSELSLTISLYYSKKNETINKYPYSFNVRMSNETDKEIYRINSEQQILRNPKKDISTDKKSYLYLIEYEYISDFNSLMIYATDSEELFQNNKVDIKAKYVDYEDYLFGNIDTNEFDFSNSDTNSLYLFLKNGFNKNDIKKSVLISVETSNSSLINLYTLFYTYYDGIFINPASPSIKFVPKNETLSLYSSDLSPSQIVFEHLGGSGEISCDNFPSPLYLNNQNMKLSMNLSGHQKDMIEIKVKENNENNNSTGLVFYLKQELINDSNNGGKPPNKNDNSINLVVIIVPIVVGVIIIALLIGIIIWYHKNKKLNEDIYKISFERERQSNLLLGDDN